MLQKWKTMESFQRKKLPFVNFQSITDNSLTVVKKILSTLLTLDIVPIDEKVVRVGFAKMRTFTVFPGFFQFVHLLFP